MKPHSVTSDWLNEASYSSVTCDWLKQSYSVYAVTQGVPSLSRFSMGISVCKLFLKGVGDFVLFTELFVRFFLGFQDCISVLGATHLTSHEFDPKTGLLKGLRANGTTVLQGSRVVSQGVRTYWKKFARTRALAYGVRRRK